MTQITTTRSGNVIVPYASATKRTKQVNLTLSGPNHSATNLAVGVAYADSAGNWRLIFNIDETVSSVADVRITVDGVTFAGNQALSNNQTSNAPTLNVTYSYAMSGTSVLRINYDAAVTSCHVSGDVALASKPTWADANMEGVVAADVYIPFGQVGMPGEVLESSVTGSAANTVDGVYKRMTTLTLTAGKWLVSGGVALQSSGAITSSKINLTTTDAAAAGVTGKSTSYAGPMSNGAGQAFVTPYLVTIPAGSSVPYYLNIQVNGSSISNDLNGAYMLAVRLAP